MSDPVSHLSPALLGEGVAYEHKYRVTPQQAVDIAAWANQHLAVDSHADPLQGYSIHTLYLDTPEFDTFRRLGRFATRKYRIRRYGDESGVWLERKRKRAGRVKKQRDQWLSEVGLYQETVAMAQPTSHWFAQDCLQHRLQPVCEVHYRRRAWDAPDGSPIRLTLDQDIVACQSQGWQIGAEVTNCAPLLPDSLILELKFCDTLPTLFRILLQDFALQPAGFSKYRTAVEHVVPLTAMAASSASSSAD